MIEYAVVIVTIVAIMFVPFVDGDSVFEMLIEGFKRNYAAFIYALSIPS